VIDRDRERTRSIKRRQPCELCGIDNRGREQQVRYAGCGEHFHLANRRTRNAERPCPDLQASDLHRFVGLRVGPQAHTRSPGNRGHVLDVTPERRQIDDESWRFHFTERAVELENG
jgi:hypothetical protein